MANAEQRKKAKRASSARARARREEAERKAEKDARPQSSGESIAAALHGLSKAYADCGKDGVSPAMTDAITQSLLLILGTAPSIAASDGLMMTQAANGAMYLNAVANQQKTNLLGMAMTAKCVRYMLDGKPEDPVEDIIIEEED